MIISRETYKHIKYKIQYSPVNGVHLCILPTFIVACVSLCPWSRLESNNRFCRVSSVVAAGMGIEAHGAAQGEVAPLCFGNSKVFTMRILALLAVETSNH